MYEPTKTLKVNYCYKKKILPTYLGQTKFKNLITSENIEFGGLYRLYFKNYSYFLWGIIFFTGTALYTLSQLLFSDITKTVQVSTW